MTTSSVTRQKAVPATSGSFGSRSQEPADSRADGQSGYETKSQKFDAVYLSQTCEHDWLKLPNDLQTLETEGKTIWKCRTCAEITNTYDWQKP